MVRKRGAGQPPGGLGAGRVHPGCRNNKPQNRDSAGNLKGKEEEEEKLETQKQMIHRVGIMINKNRYTVTHDQKHRRRRRRSDNTVGTYEIYGYMI